MSQNLFQLYKSIRRLHRNLPPALRYMGNQYVRDEWRRHKNCEPKFVPEFIKAWTAYRDTLQEQLESSLEIGAPLKEKLDELSPTQLGQLQELRNASKGVKKV